MAGKRLDYIDFDTYFMTTALASSERSKDPRTVVGAVIVKNNYIISVGYNGTPMGMDDDMMPWDSLGEETGDLLQIKNSFVVHAEANALDHLPKNFDAHGSTIYVTLFPCSECAKRIVNIGVKKVVYLKDYKNTIVSRKLFQLAGVEVVKFQNYEGIYSCLNNIEKQLNNLENNNSDKVLKYNQ